MHQHGKGWEKGKSEVNHVHQREQDKREIIGRDDAEETFLQEYAVALEGAVVRPEVGRASRNPEMMLKRTTLPVAAMNTGSSKPCKVSCGVTMTVFQR